jgi:hypothetical protein
MRKNIEHFNEEHLLREAAKAAVAEEAKPKAKAAPKAKKAKAVEVKDEVVTTEPAPEKKPRRCCKKK